MIARLIRWSIDNRFLVLLATLVIAAWGVWAVLRTPLDAIPDLSDVQVIIRTPYPGQAPHIVEDQVTYPLATTMMSVPGAKTVRGYSMFGDSFVYVLFEDGTDLYWARSRVLEYLNQVSRVCRASASPRWGPTPPASAGSTSTRSSIGAARYLSQLRALQDWFLKYELKSVPNVAEVATVGGMVRSTRSCWIRIGCAPTASHTRRSSRRSRRQPGDRRLGAGDGRGGVHGARSGYLQSLDDFRRFPLSADSGGVAGAPRRRRTRPDRSGDAPRHRRARRRRRSGWRHRRHALGQERARDDQGREGEARRAQAEPAARRGDRADLRSLEPDRARRRATCKDKLDRGVHRRRARLRGVPVPSALGVRRDRLAAARHA